MGEVTGVLWCADCGAEHELWAEGCAFCGGALSGTEPAAEVVDHSLAEVDVADLGPEHLAHLELLLNSEGVPHTFGGGSLRFPAARTDVVTECLAEVDAVGTTDSDEEGGGGPGSALPAASLATTGRRVAARVLASAIWWTAVVAATVVVVIGVGVDSPLVVVAPVVVALVADVGLVAVLGWDFGNLLLGLRVVGYDDRPPGWWRALVRGVVLWGPFVATRRLGLVLWPHSHAAGSAVSWAGLAWFAVLVVSISRHPGRRGWHDRAAGTHVLDVRRSSWTR